MSLVEQWAGSEALQSGEEEPAGAWTGESGLAKIQLLNGLVLDSPPPQVIADAKLLFSEKLGSGNNPTP